MNTTQVKLHQNKLRFQNLPSLVLLQQQMTMRAADGKKVVPNKHTGGARGN